MKIARFEYRFPKRFFYFLKGGVGDGTYKELLKHIFVTALDMRGALSLNYRLP